MSRRRKQLSSDDAAIWKKVARTVVPLQPTASSESEISMAELMAETLERPSIKKSATRSMRDHAAEPHVHKTTSAPIKLPSWSPVQAKTSNNAQRANIHHPIDHKTRRKIVNGRLPIDATLDLHGMTQDRAYRALARFLDMGFASGFRTVLVITGKGSAGEGVLRRQVPQWLSDERMAAVTNGFQEAHQSHGGSGALYVRIRRIRQ